MAGRRAAVSWAVRPRLRLGVALLVVAATGPAMPTLAATPSPAASPAPSVSPAPAAFPAPSTSSPRAALAPAALADAVVQRIGRLRVAAGCLPWHPAGPLQRTAQAYSRAISESGALFHVDALGGTAQDRARQAGYRGNVIELLASAVTDQDAFLNGLSPWADQTDLLDCRYRSFGAALDHGYLVVLVGDR